MKNNTELCQICGSEKIKRHEVTWAIQEPYGSLEHFSFTEIRCSHCKESYTNDDYDAAILPAIYKSKKASLIKIISFFEKMGYSKSNVERILGLDQKSIDRYIGSTRIDPAFYILILTYRDSFPDLFKKADIPHGFNRAKLFTDIGNE